MEVSELQAHRNLYDHCPSEDEAGTGRRFNSSYIQQLNIILKSSFKLSGTSSDAERNKNTRYWLLQTAAGHHFTIYKRPPLGHNLKWHRIYNEFSEEICQTQR